MPRIHNGEPLVDGTCSTVAEYKHWAYGGPAVPNSRASVSLFCQEGDDAGRAAMQHDGRCPHDAWRYLTIQRARARLLAEDARMLRQWERQGQGERVPS